MFFFLEKSYILDHSESIDIQIKNNLKKSEFKSQNLQTCSQLIGIFVVDTFSMLYSLFKLLQGKKLNLYERKNIS